MKIKKIVVGSYVENTYVISQGKFAFIVDPGDNFEKIDKYVLDNFLELKFIILTHGHLDHIASANKFREKYGIKVYANIFEKDLLNNCNLNLSCELKQKIELDADIYVKDGDELNFCDKKIKFIHTPGHTKGSMCILCDDFLISGDTLFKGTIGRTDLPTSNFEDIVNSIKNKIFTLDETLKVFPGHGFSTNIYYEKNNNKYLKK